MDPNAVLNRIVRLARLDTTVFDEVKDDEKELVPAVVIVAVSAFIAGIGAWLWLLMVKPDGLDIDYGNVIVKIWLLGTVFAVVLWGVWAAVTYFFLVQVFKEQADIQALLRTMGYAAFPLSASILLLLGGIDGLGLPIGIAAVVLWFVMTTYAVQATTSAPSNSVVMSNAVGFLVFAVVLGLIGAQTGMTTGVFVTDGDTLDQGEYFDVPKVDLSDFLK